jgi:hypothetical protein
MLRDLEHEYKTPTLGARFCEEGDAGEQRATPQLVDRRDRSVPCSWIDSRTREEDVAALTGLAADCDGAVGPSAGTATGPSAAAAVTANGP